MVMKSNLFFIRACVRILNSKTAERQPTAEIESEKWSQ